MMMHGDVSNHGLGEGLVRFWQRWLCYLHVVYLLMVLCCRNYFSAFQNQWHLQ